MERPVQPGELPLQNLDCPAKYIVAHMILP